MANYKLLEDEVVLFKEECESCGFEINGKEIEEFGIVILTNYNMIFSYKNAQNEKSSITTSLDNIKVYNNIPQVKIASHSAKKVEIYLTTQEIYLIFANTKLAKAFVSVTNKLFKQSQTFDETLVKIKSGLNKAKQVINAIDETFEVDTVALATGTIKQQATVVSQNKVVNALNGVVSIVENAKGKYKKSKTQVLPSTKTTDEQPADSNNE